MAYIKQTIEQMKQASKQARTENKAVLDDLINVRGALIQRSTWKSGALPCSKLEMLEVDYTRQNDSTVDQH